jgi:DNA-directed RNA polymerase specialized sigma24 family protein
MTTLRTRADLRAIESAYTTGYRRYVRLAAAISGRPDIAPDVVQEAFARAVRSRSSYRGDGPVEGWIARIVVNVARDEARRPPAPALEAADPHGGDAPEIRPLVAALPERQRLVLFLRYYADLPYAAIAEALDLDAGTIGPTLTAALRSLRARMSEVET